MSVVHQPPLAERLSRDFTDQAVPFVANADALAIIDAQRQMPGSSVGGFVQLTTILRDSITTKVLHRWSTPLDPAETRRKATSQAGR